MRKGSKSSSSGGNSHNKRSLSNSTPQTIVTEVLVNGSRPPSVGEEIAEIVKEGVSAIRVGSFVSQWQENVSNWESKKDPASSLKNYQILSDLIDDPHSVSDHWLYTFLTKAKIRPSGGWFFEGQVPRAIANEFETHRGRPVTIFFEEMQKAEEAEQAERLKAEQASLLKLDADWSQEKDRPGRLAFLRRTLSENSIPDIVIFTFLKNNHVHFGDYVNARSFPRSLRINPRYEDLFKDTSKTSQQLSATPLPQLIAQWEENSHNGEEDANYRILESLIEDPSVVTDEQLYQFLVDVHVRLSGGWFYSKTGEPTDLSLEIAQKRNRPVTEFFKNGFLQSIRAKWAGASEQDKTTLVQQVIKHTLVSDDEVRDVIDKLHIDVPALLGGQADVIFQTNRGRPFGTFMAKSTAPAAAAQGVMPSPSTMDDPLKCMITLNSHGSFSNKQFTLPQNVYVLVPHPQGLDQPYIVESPQGGLSFEEMIYRSGGSADRFPSSSGGGWRVYKPGELVHNLHLSPWTPSTDVNEEFTSWSARVPPEDAAKARPAGGSVPQFALVPARDGSQNPLRYGGEEKSKVKVFGSTDLQTVITKLQKEKPGEPIVLVPFACNYQSGTHNLSIQCSTSPTPPANIKGLF
jgi:hypothetical protein